MAKPLNSRSPLPLPATLAIPNHEALAPGRLKLMTATARPATSRAITCKAPMAVPCSLFLSVIIKLSCPCSAQDVARQLILALCHVPPLVHLLPPIDGRFARHGQKTMESCLWTTAAAAREGGSTSKFKHKIGHACGESKCGNTSASTHRHLDLLPGPLRILHLAARRWNLGWSSSCPSSSGRRPPPFPSACFASRRT